MKCRTICNKFSYLFFFKVYSHWIWSNILCWQFFVFFHHSKEVIILSSGLHSLKSSPYVFPCTKKNWFFTSLKTLLLVLSNFIVICFAAEFYNLFFEFFNVYIWTNFAINLQKYQLGFYKSTFTHVRSFNINPQIIKYHFFKFFFFIIFLSLLQSVYFAAVFFKSLILSLCSV